MAFETGVSDAPFSIAGTAFLVGFNNNLYVITAKHVLRSWLLEKLVIYPSDRSSEGLRLSELRIVEAGLEMPDNFDLVLIRADGTNVPKETLINSGFQRHRDMPPFSMSVNSLKM